MRLHIPLDVRLDIVDEASVPELFVILGKDTNGASVYSEGQPEKRKQGYI